MGILHKMEKKLQKKPIYDKSKNKWDLHSVDGLGIAIHSVDDCAWMTSISM